MRILLRRQSQTSVSESSRMAENGTAQCSWTGCGQAAKSILIERSLCIEHFLELANRRIVSIAGMLEHEAGERSVSAEVQAFLSQLISQTTTLATEMRLLNPGRRDELLALSTTAAELYKRIHRKARVERQVACSIRTGTISRQVEGTCKTVNIGLQGASVETEMELKVEQTVTLERMDTKTSARCKVRWVKKSVDGGFLMGLQILDQKDYWGLELPASKRGAETRGVQR
jgi:PilZ domain